MIHARRETHVRVLHASTDQVYTDRQLARVSVLTFDVTSAVYAPACGKCLASVMKKFNKKIDRKNPNFGNKTAILKNI